MAKRKYPNIGKRIRAIRKSSKLGVPEFSDIVGVGETTIRHIEKVGNANYLTLCKIARGLGVGVVDLIGGDSEWR